MTELKLVKAKDVLSTFTGIKGCILGVTGIGKTSLAKTLDTKRTLFCDLESGLLALGDWGGDVLPLRSWEQCQKLASYMSGADESVRYDDPYGGAYYQQAVKEFSPIINLDNYDTFFLDSLTVASRLCLKWASQQPEVMSLANKENGFKKYSILGEELINWVTRFQHIPKKNIWLVCLLDKVVDELSSVSYKLQIEGLKAAREIPGIVDEVITMAQVKVEGGGFERKFICQTMNGHQYPAKDRSGQLNLIEEPNLGKLMTKIKNNNLKTKS